jgi:hypothetical protein
MGTGGARGATLIQTQSYQFVEPGASNAWLVEWESENDAVVDPTSLAVYALCVPNAIP